VSTSIAQFETSALFLGVPIEHSHRDFGGSDRACPKRIEGLVAPREHRLPELVTRFRWTDDTNEISVGGRFVSGLRASTAVTDLVDNVQLRETFSLAHQEDSTRDFSSLSMAEQQLEKRRYGYWLKREPKKGASRIDELAIWIEGGSDADENFMAWWLRKENRRRESLFRKANRLACCQVVGRRMNCSRRDEHRFYTKFACGNRYCRYCGPNIFTTLFGKYMALWPLVEELVVRPGFRSQNVIAQLDFTAVNLDRMLKPREVREFNQDIRECIRRVTKQMGISAKHYGFMWCDEFGGWDPKRQVYNTNLHAHGVYVGPFIPQNVLAETWMEIRAPKDGAKIVWIQKQKIDNQPKDSSERERCRFVRALGHALKYTGKHVACPDGERLGQLEIAFHGVKRVHAMGLFYNADLFCRHECSTCKEGSRRRCERWNCHAGDHYCNRHRPGVGCPLCSNPQQLVPLLFPGESADAGYGLVAMFEVEGRRDLAVVRREVGRDQIFGGPRGPGAETTLV
jgi:hypothetical protein